MAQTFPFLQDEAYHYLQQQIKEGAWEPDKTYSLTAVAEQLNMSRTPVRGALQKLEQEGLVESLPSRGFRLRAASREQIHELYQIRCAIEGYCCYQLARQCSEEQDGEFFAALKDSLDQQRQAVEQGLGIPAYFEEDRRFHGLLLQRLGNEELERIMSTYRIRIRQFALESLYRPGLPAYALTEHERIFDAIRRGDAAAAQAALLEHMNTAVSPWPRQE